MGYRSNIKRVASVLAFIVTFGTGAMAHADPDAAGPFTGPRECDATNVDGYCIAWHSTLKGVSPSAFANCTAWSCDLRAEKQRHKRRVSTPTDNDVTRQLAVTPHAITPQVIEVGEHAKHAAH